MNGTSGFLHVRPSIPRSSSNRLLHEQGSSDQGPGNFSILTIASLAPQKSAQRENRFLTPFSVLKQTRMQVDFAHPQSPWERGTNENTNGLLRQFFPAGTRFNQVSRREIKRVQALLNDRPSKILNWHSPVHAFHQLLH